MTMKAHFAALACLGPQVLSQAAPHPPSGGTAAGGAQKLTGELLYLDIKNPGWHMQLMALDLGENTTTDVLDGPLCVALRAPRRLTPLELPQ